MNRQEHLLTCLAEECDEVGQRVAKALRFSLGEIQEGQPLTNAQRIVEELHDLLCVAEILEAEGYLPRIAISTADIKRKRAKIEKFMAISREHGALSDDELEAAGLSVKPLEWVEFGEGPRCITICGMYAIHPSSGANGKPTLTLTGMPGDLFGKFSSIKEAKAAAQADYERRILSALISQSDEASK